MSASAGPYVLDSFAMLAYLGGEDGMARVRALLLDCTRGRCRVYLSLINLGEVLYITERELGITRAQEALAAIDQLPIEVVPASREAVLAAAHIKAAHPVAYADAFAVAAAMEHGATVVTGDPEFEAVKGLVQVEWLPQVP